MLLTQGGQHISIAGVSERDETVDANNPLIFSLDFLAVNCTIPITGLADLNRPAEFEGQLAPRHES